MSKRVFGIEGERVAQVFPRLIETALGPLKQPEISICVFHTRVQAHGLVVFMGSFIAPAQAGEGESAKISNAGIGGRLLLGSRKFRQRNFEMAVFQRTSAT